MPVFTPATAPAADDPIPGLVGFTAVLRAAGLAIATDRVAAFLSALHQKDPNQHRAMAETFGVDPEGLQVRFVRWLHEVASR